MTQLHRSSPLLDSLVELFYSTPGDLAEFEEVAPAQIPAPYGELLVHDQHMTVTVERFHQSPVDVHVLDVGQTKTHYARKILLSRQSDGRVVQFGLVRLCLDFLAPQVRREITDRQTPLGRVLIKHNVLRQVQLISLLKVTPGADLRQLFNLPDAPAGTDVETTYGRTALIYCNGVPAVELLEIVTPVP